MGFSVCLLNIAGRYKNVCVAGLFVDFDSFISWVFTIPFCYNIYPSKE